MSALGDANVTDYPELALWVPLQGRDVVSGSPYGGSMSTLTDRPNTALLVIDVQKDVTDGAQDRDAVVSNISSLVDRARSEGVPVVWVAHNDDGMPRDSDQWQYVDELVREDDEPLVHKTYNDSFEATELEDVLVDKGVGRLVVSGAQTDACIRATLHGGLVRGYDVTLVSDAHTTQDMTQWGNIPPADVIKFTNLYWSFTSAPGREVGVSTSEDVAFA